MPILGAVSQPARGAFRFGKPRMPEWVEYLVIAGGGGSNGAGAGGAGGYRSSVVGESSGRNSSAESRLTPAEDTNYTVTIGAGGGSTPTNNGSPTTFASITSTGGGGWTNSPDSSGGYGNSGGSGGGSTAWLGPYDIATRSRSGPSGTSGQGFNGGAAYVNSGDGQHTGAYAGGGGAGGNGGNASQTGHGNSYGSYGPGLSSSITGTSVLRAWGNGSGRPDDVANTGCRAQSGVVILRFPSGSRLPTVGAGLTYSAANSDSTYTVLEFTAGSDSIVWES